MSDPRDPVVAAAVEWREARIAVIAAANAGGEIGADRINRLALAEHALSDAVLEYSTVSA